MVERLAVLTLSISRPWAGMIVHGSKPIENRSWGTGYRGRLLLHAAKSWDPGAFRFAAGFGGAHGMSHRNADHQTGIIAVATLVDVCSNTLFGPGETTGRACDCGPWAIPGQLHWRLVDVTPLPEPVPCRGSLGLWTPPPQATATVRELLAIPTEQASTR